MVVAQPGTTMLDPNRWQPLAPDQQIAQNGVPIPGKVIPADDLQGRIMGSACGKGAWALALRYFDGSVEPP